MTPLQTIQLIATAPSRGGSNFLVGLLLAGGIGLITFVMLRSVFKRRKRDRLEYETPSEKMDRITSQGMPRDRIETLMVEAQELTRACAAQIESKAMVLERLITQADERIARLEQLESDSPSPSTQSTFAAEPKHAPAPAQPTDPLTRKVYELADSGTEPMDIARELDEQVGKVDLILALRAH